MDLRTAKFKNLEDHPWLGKVYQKLSPDEVQICMKFLQDNTLLSKGEFESKAVRMFMDKANKPRNWTIIEELLVCANSSL